MNVVLISPQGSLIAYGLRQIGACLRQAGHSVRMVFLPMPEEIEPLPGKPIQDAYPPEIVEAVGNLCRDAGLVGMSCATQHFHRLAQLADHVRGTLRVPVIWGGIHATVSPEDCLAHADWVCRGEGELAMVELARDLERGGHGRAVANLGWRNAAGETVLNPLRPLLQDLDALPYPLYETDGHYILHRGRIVPLAPALACWHLSDGYSFGRGSAYHVWATRGCPHRCAYCCNSFYSGIYPDWNRVRRQSNRRIVDEIRFMRGKMPYVDHVAFMDDTFFAAAPETIEDFAARYKEQVDLPFFACASPSTLDERRLEALVAAGLRHVWVGMQSGSARIQHLYRRHDEPAVLRKTAALLAKYKGRVRAPVYDFIVDPLFQQPEDQRLTLELLDGMAYPFQLELYSMAFFPGTEITRLAQEQGGGAAAYGKNIVRLDRNFYRAALWAHGRNLPKSALRMLSTPAAFRLLNARGLRGFWWMVGAGLERRERRQLIDWTARHRRSVVERHFPDQNWRELAADLFRG
ncbi:MAG: radical SAM protein [Kiritimatiellia bacterium]